MAMKSIVMQLIDDETNEDIRVVIHTNRYGRGLFVQEGLSGYQLLGTLDYKARDAKDMSETVKTFIEYYDYNMLRGSSEGFKVQK
jgi:hypothetical protein